MRAEFISAASRLLAKRWKQGLGWIHGMKTARDELLDQATQPDMYALQYKLKIWQWFDSPLVCLRFCFLRHKLIHVGKLKIKELLAMDNFLAAIEFSRNSPKGYAERQAIRKFILNEGYSSWQVFEAFCSKATDSKTKQDWPRVQPQWLQRIANSNPYRLVAVVTLFMLALSGFFHRHLANFYIISVTFLFVIMPMYFCAYLYRLGKQWEQGQLFFEKARLQGINF